jgi:arylsulfatase A-like enzyme/Flp pilus assembly protein TadD
VSKRLTALLTAIVACLLVVAIAWSQRGRRGPRREPGLSVLLITVDTLRADALGAYGNRSGPTTWMDRLAARGMLFEDSHAHNVVTLPSHANILSGRYPLEHGVRDNAGFRFPPRTETLATLLAARGYGTGAFVSAFPVSARFGLDRGFDVYDDAFVGAGPRPAFLEQERPGPETVALARRWVEAQGDRPFFCWVHLFEPHYPYAPPEPFATRFRGDAYHGDVAAADAALGPLLEPLLAAGDQGRTLVVLTSDHGESLGEHGEKTHGILAYEATLRVPLILYAPRLFAARRVSAPARHVDLLPTILDALALPVPGGLPGRTLLPLATGEPAGETTSYFEALSGRLNRGWAPLTGVIRGRTKYVDLPIPELYELANDGAESRNLASQSPERLAQMHVLLGQLRSADRGIDRRTENAEAQERLRSLGYLAGSAATQERYTEADDPKRLIALDALLQDVVDLYFAGDLPGAVARGRELVRQRPQMPLSWLYLGQLQREAGDLPGAVASLRKALALNPADATTLSLLGACLTLGGQPGEAVALLAPHVQTEPDVDAMTTLALALARLGRHEEALATLGRSRAQEPRNAMVLVELGTVHLMANQREPARAAFEEALALNPGAARAHSSLGFMAAESGRVDEALAHWRRSIAVDPRECEKLLALGALLWSRGRASEARSYLDLFVASAPPARYAREIERVRGRLTGEVPQR